MDKIFIKSGIYIFSLCPSILLPIISSIQFKSEHHFLHCKANLKAHIVVSNLSYFYIKKWAPHDQKVPKLLTCEISFLIPKVCGLRNNSLIDAINLIFGWPILKHGSFQWTHHHRQSWLHMAVYKVIPCTHVQVMPF